ncbi:uncharacterized protein SAPINGB_P000074 [Magnusiomyces paraingens]|uniref:3'(2'),5'-bisphosphate nucleotidase n=1 Tax=Magnusiomyces paraingens TaxID=2606893 RepID=A0A5E8B2N4_9ASCO|nr:uncharacterized protein SAPINGB_P000074 [Saprochaete ingens]VVT43635.1 unnamed protein product [Saprochaete ingens]
MSFALEKKVAELAVKRASALAKLVADTHIDSITKTDKSPVTVADYGAQAIIINAIKHVFPNDNVVGEEDAANLRADPTLKQHVWSLVKDATDKDSASASAIGSIQTAEEMCDSIDAGNYEGGRNGRMWALDPIDGTKGFLRRGQYAVCLALVVDSVVQVGVIGCPNLPLDYKSSGTSENGVLFSAVKGLGAFQQSLFGSEPEKPIKFHEISSTSEATFCESVEAGHSSHDTQAKIAQTLGITKPPVRMDSQAKYVSIARGDGDIYLRLPVHADYQEKIWDHAAGNVIVTEAGGVVTDKDGHPLDFGVGRTLKDNKGVIAASKAIHAKVLEAVKNVTGA